MGKTAVSSVQGQVVAGVAPGRSSGRRRLFSNRVLTAAASLRITVVLFALSVLLVFFGTLAQVHAGIWTVVNDYFRALYVWIPFRIFFPEALQEQWKIRGSFPYLGGWLLGGLLLVNLLAAHLVRFKLSLKRSGILLIHAGLIVLMLSELVTGLFAIEGNMTIELGGGANFIQKPTASEFAVIDSSNPKMDDVVVVPGVILRKGGLIRHDELPFDVEVVRYMTNSAPPRKITPDFENPATQGAGKIGMVQPLAEGVGVDPDQKVDAPSAYLTFKKKGSGETLGTYLVSVWLTEDERPQRVAVAGKTYDVYLRFKRIYKPYTLHLKKFTHEFYPGTEVPKAFESLVGLDDPSRNEKREVRIYMNNPLRYAGETFYQSGWLKGDRGTILQVVRNPGWLMPYISCAMVSIGMLIHFGMRLFGFLSRRVAS